MLNLSMKPTGWFQIGWSQEIPSGSVKPLKYFGHDLVAFRSDDGELAVLDAHCHHLGAHLGHGGKVKGDCVACPYHGWQWNTRGENALIPYQDQPVRKKLRKWDIVEQHGIIFMWHDPAGGPPREGWLPDVFDHPEKPANPGDYYPCYPDAVVFAPNERIHPQLMTENAADTMHFRFAHNAPEDPVLLSFDTDGPIWEAKTGFRSKATKEVAMVLYARNAGVGLNMSIFDHPVLARRLVLTCTPVDDDTSDLRVSYFFQRDARSPEVMPEHVREMARQTRTLFEEDAVIWRHQKFVQRPIFAKADVAGYSALRNWCAQFYEATGVPQGPMKVLDA
ncbi:MAG TPA: Rieske (2Fe-2S) protein [Pseudomonas xinjiangensis]|uniref:cholesterol 7-desaturase n=2 Tax=root TaxID=1 RepID=A0A7V1FT96_9GAMM|nr:Rieske (2Fe-2S) protein [Halopseudomonas xinjiangensis]HEC47382.1 Rieske (2Fe-2S) protein [Halopseudomonas xinjiangensis]